jgi:hypothetical protein
LIKRLVIASSAAAVLVCCSCGTGGGGTGPGAGTPADTVRRIEAALRDGSPGEYVELLDRDYVFTAHTPDGEREWGRDLDYTLVSALFFQSWGRGCTVGWRDLDEPGEGVTEYTADVTMQIYVTLEGNVRYCAEGSGEMTFRPEGASGTWLVTAWDDDATGAETTLAGYEPLSWGEIKLLFEEG